MTIGMISIKTKTLGAGPPSKQPIAVLYLRH